MHTLAAKFLLLNLFKELSTIFCGGSRLSAFDLFILSYFIHFLHIFATGWTIGFSWKESWSDIVPKTETISKNLPLHTKYINRDGPLASPEANIELSVDTQTWKWRGNVLSWRCLQWICIGERFVIMQFSCHHWC